MGTGQAIQHRHAPRDTPLSHLARRYRSRYALDLANLVDPNFGFNPQLYAMVWGTMYFPTNWSNSWVHDSRIAVLPSELPDWPADEIVRFFYPVTGLTYRAHSSGTEVQFGVTHQKAVGARMLEWANHLMTLAYLVDTDVGGQPLFNADGSPVLTLDANGKAQENPANPGAKAALQKFVDNIDLFRQLTAKFEMPLGDEDLPQP